MRSRHLSVQSRTRTAIALAGSALVAGLALSACGSGGGSNSGSSSSTGAGTAKSIEISVLTAGSGGCAPLEESGQLGMEIAAEKVNEKGITVDGKPYELVIKTADTKGENTEGINVVRTQIQEGIKFFLGGVCSIGNMPGVTALYEQSGVLAINNFGSAGINSATEAESIKAAETTSKNLFSNTLSYADQGVRDSNLVQVFPELPKKVFLLFPNNEFGESLVQTVGHGLDEQGIEYQSALFDPTTKDFSGFLSKVKAYGPEVLWGPFEPEPALAILRQAIQLEAAPQYIGYGTPIEEALKTAIGKPIPIPAVWDQYPVSLAYSDNPALKELAKELEAKTGGTLDPTADEAATSYDFVGMLAAAMEKAGTTEDPDKVAEALAEIEYKSAWFGTLKYDPTHHVPTTVDGCYIEPPGKVQPCQAVGVDGLEKE